MSIIILNRGPSDGVDWTDKIAVYMSGFEFSDGQWLHMPCGHRHSLDQWNGERIFMGMLRHVAECPKLMTILGPVSSWSDQPTAEITPRIREFLDMEFEEKGGDANE